MYDYTIVFVRLELIVPLLLRSSVACQTEPVIQLRLIFIIRDVCLHLKTSNDQTHPFGVLRSGFQISPIEIFVHGLIDTSIGLSNPLDGC